jgi:hypothetical protein
MPCRSPEALQRKRNSEKDRRIRLKQDGICVRCKKEPISSGSEASCEKCINDRRAAHEEDRKKSFEIYGSVCRCCGMADKNKLEFDHVNGDGTRDRELYGPARVQKKIANGEYPLKDIQPLCGSCHNSKTKFGYCDCKKHYRILPLEVFRQMCLLLKQSEEAPELFNLLPSIYLDIQLSEEQLLGPEEPNR